MIVIFLFLGALALLVTLLLFGFVGCGLDEMGELSPTDYSATIEATTCLVSYWRLGDSTPVPSATGAAVDQVGGNPGTYLTVPATATADGLRYSPATAGVGTAGETPGLLETYPSDPCFDTNGGYVQVPFTIQLNPLEFTFEAWVSPDPSIQNDGFFYCLAESTGPPGLGPREIGWGLYLGPSAPGASDGPYWQVWMGSGPSLIPGPPPFNRVAIANGSDNPTQLRLTYLALTFDASNNLQLWLYYPDTNQSLDVQHLQGAQNPSVNNFFQNDTGDFFIGTGSNLFPTEGAPAHRLYPFKGKIQEVALYNCSLVGSAPNFNGLASNLGVHELAGGNI
jgi:hypothetical protein